MSDTFKLSVPWDPKYVSTVRLTISSLANAVGFDIEAIEDIKVAVSEACNNIILHSGIEGGEYQIICTTGKDRLEIVVKDDGVGYETENYKKPDLEQPTEGGLGVFIIRALMDDVEVNSEVGAGTIIRMTKLIKTN